MPTQSDGNLGADGAQATRASLVISPIDARRTPLGVGDSFVLIVPMLQFIQFHSVGTLFATDLILLAALPVVLARGMNRLRNRQVATILMIGIAWFFAQVVTDILRDSPPEDYLRGWSKIGLTVTHFTVIWILLRNSARRFVLYGVGVCIGGALSSLIFPNEFQATDLWKFGLALPTTLAVVLVASWLSLGRRKSLVLFALIGMSGVNLFMNLRSLGLICLVAAGYSYFCMQAGEKRRTLGELQIPIIATAVLLSVFGFQKAYEYSIECGWLGSAALDKYSTQQAGEGGVLLGGRSEILSSAKAIMDSPVIGHGSWAKDPEYAALMRERMVELGYKDKFDSRDDLIPTHSHLFGAWVEAGIVGALFWLWILKLVVTALWRATGSEPLLPVFAFMAFLLCWDILFSPYGAERRFLTTYFIAGIVLLLSFSRDAMFVKAGVMNHMPLDL
jgi:hypothetical protein